MWSFSRKLAFPWVHQSAQLRQALLLWPNQNPQTFLRSHKLNPLTYGSVLILIFRAREGLLNMTEVSMLFVDIGYV